MSHPAYEGAIMKRISLALAGLAFAVTLCACSDDGGSPSTLAIAKTATNSGDAQAGTAGVALANPLRVVVTEGGGVKSGVTVTWAAANGGTLTPGGVTDASGVATATWTLGPAGGAQTAAASLSGAIGSPVTFTATAGASTLAIAKTATNSGDAQAGTAGLALANPLRVVVTEGGGVKSGVTVTWAAANGGTLTPGGVTDASGVATATWTLGAAGGAQTATASLSGASGSPVTFTATAAAVPTITVVQRGYQNGFSPATITINAGQSVRFVWGVGAIGHNVTPDDGNASALPASPGLPALLSAPESFSATFPSAGTFKFFCSAHGANPSPGTVSGMSGTVTVN